MKLISTVMFLLLATVFHTKADSDNGSGESDVDAASNLSSNKLVCDTIKAGTDPATLLIGRHITIGLYSGELSQLDESTGKWSGYDIDLMDKLAKTGQFTYDIKSIGQSVNITNYTHEALTVLGDNSTEGGGADLMGQGTWRWNADRSKWAIWSVPMVSEDVQFVTKGPSLEDKKIAKAMLILVEPFRWEVWVTLIVAMVGFTWMLRSVEAHESHRVRSQAMGKSTAEGTAAVFGNIWLAKVRERRESANKHVEAKPPSHEERHAEPIAQTMYNTCVSCPGVHSDHLAAPPTNALRTIHAGWIFFIFLIAEVYGSNLTAILTLGPETSQVLNGLEDCIEKGCNFCVQTGAANEAYFRKTYQPRNLQVVGKDNIPAQIEGIIDGTCDAVELTSEDLFKWTTTEHDSTRRCKPRIVGIPIVRRHRGMMAKVEKSCYITALNAVYARFATESKDNAVALNQEHFLEPTCDELALEDREALAMNIGDLGGAFILLAIVSVYGFSIVWFGDKMATTKKHTMQKHVTTVQDVVRKSIIQNEIFVNAAAVTATADFDEDGFGDVDFPSSSSKAIVRTAQPKKTDSNDNVV